MDPITAILGIGNKLIDHFFPDANQAAAAKLELLKMQQSGDLQVMASQMEINKIEAQNPSLFVSGWRPFIGWVCGISLTYAAIIEPVSRFLAKVAFNYIGEFPVIDTTLTLQILLGLLGLAGMRSWEKKEGVAAK
jgi:Holin of 3TMs, for gene-transfer release